MSEIKGRGTRTDEPLAVTCGEPEVVTVHQRLKEIERKLDHIFALLVTKGEREAIEAAPPSDGDRKPEAACSLLD